MIEFTVPNKHSGLRLDRFLALSLPQFSRARLQELIRQGAVTWQGKIPRPRVEVCAGDVVRLTEPEPEPIEAQPEEIPLQILFEDDDLLVVNKPAGLVVHPGAGNQEHTLVNALLHHCAILSGIGGKQRPGIVHRLDKQTSGAMAVAKNDATHQELSRQFADREITKIYLTLVTGSFRRSHGTIDASIGRHPIHRKKMAVNPEHGRSARTDYRVLKTAGGVSLVECTLHSGRTHQIRVHLHHLGHPVLGDSLYGRNRQMAAPRQMLHSWKLGFTHPRTGARLNSEAALPEDFRASFPGTLDLESR
jgi:23S rRNA pseudouridine1911/1915/1917 synthase